MGDPGNHSTMKRRGTEIKKDIIWHLKYPQLLPNGSFQNLRLILRKGIIMVLCAEYLIHLAYPILSMTIIAFTWAHD